MLGLDNKYKHWYFKIISASRERTLTGYYEKHHIVPRACGGSDRPTNIACLTPREHFICHRLLPRFLFIPRQRKAMIAALWIIKHKGGHNLTSKSYATLRQEYAAHLSWLKTGKKTGPFSEQARKNMSEARLRDGPWMKGKKHTEEAKVAMSAKRKGVYTGEKNSFFGKNHSEETKKLQSLKKKAQKKFPCAFCGGEYCASMLTRWHGDNCKHKGVI